MFGELMAGCVFVRRAMSRLVFGATVLLAFPYFASAQPVQPAGLFGFLVNQWHPGGSNGTALIGTMALDGSGNLQGSYTVEATGQPAQTVTGRFTGAYSVNPDGTGSLTTALDTGVTLTYAMVMIDGGQGFELVATSCTGLNSNSNSNSNSNNIFSNAGSGSGSSVISGSARAIVAAAPTGSYGFQLSGSPSPNSMIGLITFDGNGNLAGSFTDVINSSSNQPLLNGFFIGTYSSNPDGTATMNISVDPSTTVSFTMVTVNSGSQIIGGSTGVLLLQTAGTQNNVVFGEARSR